MPTNVVVHAWDTAVPGQRRVVKPLEWSDGAAKVRPSVRGRNHFSAANLGATAAVVDMRGAACPCTVWVRPAAGNTLRVEYAVEDAAVTTPANVQWFPWPNGDVNVASTGVLDSPVTALRFTRVGGLSDTNSYGVVI